ncbi:zinc-dependent metalloprotease [Maribacter dokdonensis]|uniref:zinc-dependent metalloprotease n=1 Tax=Maribacter dokdonensis TaxID=320912 RepID=UPI001B323B7C|nr:zinc-dependent metalloprotease [Maribacter dokdonensis]
MKTNIITFFLLLSVMGYGSNETNKKVNPAITFEPIENGSFLTSFIEGDQLYLNVPQHLLEKPMLFLRYEESPQRSYMQVVWSLHGDKLVLKPQSIKSTAGIIIPFKRNIPSMDNILAIFPVEKKCEGIGSYCINITKLIMGLDIEWSQWPSGFTGSPIPDISLLLGSKDFDNEVIIKTRRGLMKDGSKVSFPVYFGFYGLGEPMRSRRYDYRMGYWNEEVFGIDFGIDNEGTKNDIANIGRWRLEKKYKGQKMSVPIKQITFILAPEIPEKWRPYIKAGIREWLPAFEAAGFKDAIVVEQTDSLSDWQRNSIQNNIVFWLPKKYFRGNEKEEYGGTIADIKDYRTGEILRSDIILGASPQNLEDGYFIRAAPLDDMAQKFPFPDDLVGRMYQSLAAHEAGHAFGIMDSNYGEYTYPVEKLNDIDWLETMGFSPSIMNYTRRNNIPQPEDNVPPHLLIEKVGPADHYNIQWGYMEFPEGKDEEAQLERIVRLQDSIPWYRFNKSGHEVIGPAGLHEVVETNDPVKGTRLALKNLKRAIALLPKACLGQNDNVRLERLYDKSLQLWYDQMRYVTSVIGGYDIHYKSLDQPGKIYTPLAWTAQREALDFLLANAFDAPKWLADPEFGPRIHYSTFPDKVLAFQQKLLMELLRPQRMKRFEYMETLDGYEEALNNYITALQSGLFSELKGDTGHSERRKQEIQMTYLDKMKSIFEQERLNIAPDSKVRDYTDYNRGILTNHLKTLEKDIENNLKKHETSPSSGHWNLCLKKIKELVD